MGDAMLAQDNYAAARALHEENLTLARELANLQAIAVEIGNLGSVALLQQDDPAALALYQESLALRRDIGGR
jgi:hypothetical protein